MVCASRKHNLITVNIVSELHTQLKKGDCEVYVGDMRVKIDPTGLYTYPDVVVTCDESQFEDDELDMLLNPMLLIEVLSKSTEAYDRGRKFAHYRKLGPLREYVLISQQKHHVEHFARQPDNQWLLSETTDPRGRVVLPGIDCTLSMAEVYDKVDIDASAEDYRDNE